MCMCADVHVLLCACVCVGVKCIYVFVKRRGAKEEQAS